MSKCLPSDNVKKLTSHGRESPFGCHWPRPAGAHSASRPASRQEGSGITVAVPIVMPGGKVQGQVADLDRHRPHGPAVGVRVTAGTVTVTAAGGHGTAGPGRGGCHRPVTSLAS